MEQDHNKLTAWTSFFNALSRFASRLVWTIIGVIVLAALGRYLFFQSQPMENAGLRSRGDMAIQEPIPWGDIDTEVVQSMRSAREAAAAYANTRLLAWSAELEKRIDADFLNWYFDYWQQQWLGLKSLGYWIADRGMIEKIIGEQPDMTERITQEIQEAFSKRVLRPEIAQMQLERIAAATVKVYVAQLHQHLEVIPKKYQLSQYDWERYLADIAVLTSMSEGARDLSLTLKTLTAASAVGGTVAVVKITSLLQPMMAKIGTQMTTSAAARGAGKAAAKMASKTGTKVGAKMSGKLLGPIIGVGVLIWDVWDHQHVKAVEKPILRQNLIDYLAELRYSLLYEPQTGLMTMIDGLQANMVSSLKSKPSSGKQAHAIYHPPAGAGALLSVRLGRMVSSKPDHKRFVHLTPRICRDASLRANLCAPMSCGPV